MGGFKHQRNGSANNGIPASDMSVKATMIPLPQKARKLAPRPMDDMPLSGRQDGLRQNRYLVPELPLDLLTSEANQRYAEHLRLAYEALVEVERERGLYYGNTLSDLLADCLEQAEREVYGPKGLLGAE